LHLQSQEADMPAITADTLTLPRIATATLGDTERPVKQITTGPRGYEGEGFPVVRAFAGVSTRDLDPFIHMDQMGEVDYAPGEPKGTAWHPHRGFETVTYMIDGTFLHQDSHGGGGVINNGATQWMTAGAGILHIETPPEELVMSGGLFHGLQLWVNLPAKDKFSTPRYQAIEGGDAALVTSADGGALIRIVAGAIDGHQGPGSTHTPITMAHATVQPGAQVSLPWQADYNALVYVLSGRGTVGAEQRPIHQGQLAVFGAGDRLTFAADGSQDSNRPALEVVLLGGRPIGEPVAHYGPFVMNTKEELIQALEDYQAGRLGAIPENAIMPHTSH
jgi:quercetin 2,3-dioxygenase